jgi:probable F420-dependent oxidoreductase
MQFGLVLPTDRNRNREPTACAQTVADQARRVEAAGFDSVWVGEHHFTDRNYFDNFQMLAHLAGVTEDVELGTSVCLAPLHNPAVLAEKVANLDVLSGGRVTFGCGLGYRPKEFEVFGVDRERRVPRLLETLALARRLWTEDDVTFEGREFAFEDVSINPKPVQSGGPDVWLGGGVPAAVERAATHGDAWLPGPMTPWDELAALYETYEGALNGAPPARPIWRDLFVAESTADAIDSAESALVRKYESYGDWGQENDTDLADRFEEFADPRFLLGSPDDVIKRIESYRETFGTDYLLFRTQWPGMEDDVATSSLELFCDEVLPSF